MKNGPYFSPYGNEHLRLESTAKGLKHLRVERERILDCMEEGDTLEDLAQMVYDVESKSKTAYTPYLEILEPELVGEVWVIHINLNELGQQVYDVLRGGVFWDYERHQPDFKASIQHYRDMMKKGSIEIRWVDLLTENKFEELRQLRNELVYFKMRGKVVGDKIVELEDVT